MEDNIQNFILKSFLFSLVYSGAMFGLTGSLYYFFSEKDRERKEKDEKNENNEKKDEKNDEKNDYKKDETVKNEKSAIPIIGNIKIN